ncbi:MAG: aminopeptidase [Candidatus Eiseniibacteriota bacterium]|nr:MAG: aminopeptidase [Candidatus Eisenbacteria bacterium]
MKPDHRIAKLARLLVHYSIGVKEREKVYISGSTASEPLLLELYQEVLRAGGHPRMRVELEDEKYHFYSTAQDFQLEYTDPFLLYELQTVDAVIQMVPDLNPYQLSSIDPQKKQKIVLAQKPVTETFLKRWGAGELRWVGTLCPTPSLAQEAHMSFDEYSEFVFACMNLNADDPIGFWKGISSKQQKICSYLDKAKEMRYIGQDTDLRFRCEGRKWINCDGKVNFPDGEVYTGPVEDSVEGTIRFTFPGVFQAEEIEDIFLRFEKGKVVEARAAKGEELLLTLLDTDERSRYVGEVAIGTNDSIDRFTKNMLFDEKMGGTVHLAIGAGMPQTGSKNVSAIHWDMLKDMRDGGEIYADGKLIYRSGEFLI